MSMAVVICMDNFALLATDDRVTHMNHDREKTGHTDGVRKLREMEGGFVASTGQRAKIGRETTRALEGEDAADFEHIKSVFYEKLKEIEVAPPGEAWPEGATASEILTVSHTSDGLRIFTIDSEGREQVMSPCNGGLVFPKGMGVSEEEREEMLKQFTDYLNQINAVVDVFRAVGEVFLYCSELTDSISDTVVTGSIFVGPDGPVQRKVEATNENLLRLNHQVVQSFYRSEAA